MRNDLCSKKIFKMAISAARTHGNLVNIFRNLVSNVSSIQKIEQAGIICGCNYIQTRNYRPYSVIPKKYLKRKNRDKKDRDDVYFLTDQVDPTYSVNDAVDMIKAYDLFGNEKLDLLLNMNFGEGKVCISVTVGKNTSLNLGRQSAGWALWCQTPPAFVSKSFL